MNLNPERQHESDKTHYADPDTLATLNRLERENAALRAELEAVRKDAERWRYRINYEYEISCSSTAISREEWIASRTAAIDAAIAAGKGEK